VGSREQWPVLQLTRHHTAAFPAKAAAWLTAQAELGAADHSRHSRIKYKLEYNKSQQWIVVSL